MSESEARETCSVSRCVRPAIHTEHGQIGHWYVAIFYCAEHWRELSEGTPLGAIGIDNGRVRIESVDTDETPPVTNRFPGLA
jgi:hypothetical protein